MRFILEGSFALIGGLGGYVLGDALFLHIGRLGEIGLSWPLAGLGLLAGYAVGRLAAPNVAPPGTHDPDAWFDPSELSDSPRKR